MVEVLAESLAGHSGCVEDDALELEDFRDGDGLDDCLERRVPLEVGRDAVRAAGLDDRVELRAGRVNKVARKLLVRRGRFAVALLNPMRRPLGRAAMAALAGLGVQRCVYVGPSPTSTSRV